MRTLTYVESIDNKKFNQLEQKFIAFVNESVLFVYTNQQTVHNYALSGLVKITIRKQLPHCPGWNTN